MPNVSIAKLGIATFFAAAKVAKDTVLSTQHQIKRTFVMGLLLGGIILLCGLLLIQQVLRQTERESVTYLYDALNQERMLFQRQVALGFQILQGVALSLPHLPDATIPALIKEINKHNDFIRMGVATADGKVDLADINGAEHRNIFLGDQPFFAQALAGAPAFSDFTKDPISGGIISYSGVPAEYQGKRGVLVGVNKVDIFLNILQPLAERGISAVIDKNGAYTLFANHKNDSIGNTFDGIFRLNISNNTAKEHIRANLRDGKRGNFFYSAGDVKYLAAYEPLEINGLFIFCAVPVSSLAPPPVNLLAGVAGVMLFVLLLCAFLLLRIRNIATRHHAELERMAFEDPLTGGPNLNRLQAEGAAMLNRNPDALFVVWCADIKNFKFFNEMFGYAVGDRELVRIAGLFTTCFKPFSLSCRISADKFAGIRQVESRDVFMQDITRLTRRIENDSARTSRDFPLVVHFGAFCTDSPSATALSLTDMINKASIALRSAKENRSAHCVFYADSMRGKALRLLDLEARMDSALTHGEFIMYFQPKIDIRNGNCIQGAEVLARWQQGEHVISPAEFIPLFEKNGFIIQLDRYMFSEACRWLRRHLNAGLAPISIAINVSRLSLVQENFLDSYTAIKKEYDIPDGILELECTESLAMSDESFRSRILELQKQGFRCSLDDFGSGFSSLNMLKELPFDQLKLDILFLRKGWSFARGHIVISHIIGLARELGIQTVSEGVETIEQLEFLRAKGCDLVQGYVFAKPMPMCDFEALLERVGKGPMPLA